MGKEEILKESVRWYLGLKPGHIRVDVVTFDGKIMEGMR